MFYQLTLMLFPMIAFCHVTLGIECFFQNGHAEKLKGKKIALVTNHTAIDSQLQLTADLFLKAPFKLAAIWAPEHGFTGIAYAGEHVNHSAFQNVPIYSLHGEKRRPSADLMKGIDVIVYDIQDIGIRSYTFATTLYYVMEAAAKRKIPIIVLDRPNPMGGIIVDGPMSTLRSFVGYLNIPYCHGMTIGELAKFFNSEYNIKCNLEVIAMKGWVRSMQFKDTHLTWIPTSPNIPGSDSPLFCATTGILGELGMVNIGIGFTLPFKIVGAPWIDAQNFAKALNEQKLEGVRFLPFYFRPFYGLYKAQDCQGVLIDITDAHQYRPLTTGYMIMGVLKSLYPTQFQQKLNALAPSRKTMFSNVNGNHDILQFLLKERFPAWKCMSYEQKEREAFLNKRAKYLIPTYN